MLQLIQKTKKTVVTKTIIIFCVIICTMPTISNSMFGDKIGFLSKLIMRRKIENNGLETIKRTFPAKPIPLKIMQKTKSNILLIERPVYCRFTLWFNLTNERDPLALLIADKINYLEKQQKQKLRHRVEERPGNVRIVTLSNWLDECTRYWHEPIWSEGHWIGCETEITNWYELKNFLEIVNRQS
jgi:hypothetical protein